MTGPNPIHIVETKGAGQEFQDAMMGLIDTIQKNRMIEARRQELENQKEELKLHQQQLKLQQDKFQHDVQTGQDAGELLKGIAAAALASHAANVSGPPRGTAGLTLPMQPGTAPQPGETPQGQALRLMSNSPLANLQGTPVQEPQQGQAGQNQQNPEDTALGVLAHARNPEAVADALASSKIDLAQIFGNRATEMKFNQTVQQAAERLPPNMRDDFMIYERMMQHAPAGLPAIAPRLFPSLFPKEINPQVMNDIFALMHQGAGLVSLGQARKAYGVGPIPGWEDSFMFPEEVRPVTEAMVGAMAGWTMMKGAGTVMNNTEDEQAARILDHKMGPGWTDSNGKRHPGEVTTQTGLSIMGQFRRAISIASTTGTGLTAGAMSLPLGIKGVDILMNWLAASGFEGSWDPEQTRLLNASLRFATAVKFALSGKQATLNETMTFLELVTPLVSDDPQTKADKREFRNTMEAAIKLMATGTRPTNEILDGLVERAADIGPAMQAVIDQWKREGDPITAGGEGGREHPQAEIDDATVNRIIGTNQVDQIIHQRVLGPGKGKGQLFPTTGQPPVLFQNNPR